MRRRANVGAMLCFIVWLGVACRSTATTLADVPSPAMTSTPTHTRVSTSTPGFLTDAEAIALIQEEITARGVDPHTVRIRIGGEPRLATVRYSSSYAIDGRAFQPQRMLIALAVAQVVAEVHPPVSGGVRLSVIPGGRSDVGLVVTVIDGSSLERWSSRSTTDREFVNEWTVWNVTRE
jgi:hypothetical protein